MQKLMIICLLVMNNAYGADPRYCHALNDIPRDSNGHIIRSSAVLREFKKLHPCPATHLRTGSCPGWQMNHVIPLASGGCDAIFNIQWMPVSIKTCSLNTVTTEGVKVLCEDRFERQIYTPDNPLRK